VEEPRSGLTLAPGCGTHTHRSGARAAERLAGVGACIVNVFTVTLASGLLAESQPDLTLKPAPTALGYGPIVNELLDERLERRNCYAATAANCHAGQRAFLHELIGFRTAYAKPLGGFLDPKEAAIGDDHVTAEGQCWRFVCGANSIAHRRQHAYGRVTSAVIGRDSRVNRA
jgi:hypothetical protein